MASQQQPNVFPPPSTPIPVPVPEHSSVWDRITTWASENKAVVYTIAGVTVAVAAGGVIYYSTNSVSAPPRLVNSPLLCFSRACICFEHSRSRLLKVETNNHHFRRPDTQRLVAQAIEEGEEEAQGG